MQGWIRIHRKIVNNWIFKDADKFRSWIIILLTVNHDQKKVLIGEKLFVCNRGESLNSLDTWSKLFGKNWNKSKVRRFFELLKKDSMIVLTNEQKTTRLTVCNYDSYQDTRNDSETEVNRNGNGSETSLTPNNNDKKLKNEKNIIPPPIELIKNYQKERGTNVNVNKFFNFYESKNWMVGKNKMKNWQAAFRTWEPVVKESVKEKNLFK